VSQCSWMNTPHTLPNMYNARAHTLHTGKDWIMEEHFKNKTRFQISI